MRSSSIAAEVDLLTLQVTNAVQTSDGQRPQAIAHRGYKAEFPENSMGAFKGAVEVGAHAIETDLHLSRDGVVVLSHVRNQRRGKAWYLHANFQ